MIKRVGFTYFFFVFGFDFLVFFLVLTLQQLSPQLSTKPKDLPNLQTKQLQHPPCDINFYCPFKK